MDNNRKIAVWYGLSCDNFWTIEKHKHTVCAYVCEGEELFGQNAYHVRNKILEPTTGSIKTSFERVYVCDISPIVYYGRKDACVHTRRLARRPRSTPILGTAGWVGE